MVNKLDMRVAVSKNHIYEVEEFISVDIFDSLQELEFAIPDGTYKVTDPELLTPGHHRFTVDYTIKEPRDTNKGTDLFSFYVVLPGWKQPVETVHVLLAFPYGFPVKEIKHHAIINGEPDAEDRFDHKPEEASRSYTATGKRIPADYTFWLEAELPDGYWKNTNDYARIIKAIALLAGTTAVLFLVIIRPGKGNRRSMHP